jgi:hypothetical protein
MTNQTPPQTTAEAGSRYPEVEQDAQNAQNAWKAEATSQDVGKWLEDVSCPPPRASIITAPTPPPSPAMTVAFPNQQDFSFSPNAFANRFERLVYTTQYDEESHDDDTPVLPHPSLRQVLGLFVGVGRAQSTPVRFGASMRHFRRTGLAPLGMLADVSNGGDTLSMVSDMDAAILHARSDDGSMRVDSGMGEEAGDAEGREANVKDMKRPASFVSRIAERLEDFASEKLVRMR